MWSSGLMKEKINIYFNRYFYKLKSTAISYGCLFRSWNSMPANILNIFNIDTNEVINFDTKKSRRRNISMLILILSSILISQLQLNAKLNVNTFDSQNHQEILNISDYKSIEYTHRTQLGIENATIVMLVRNRELNDALATMRQLEDRFNREYRYPWTFLNDEPFTDEFITYTTNMASGKTEYGLIPESHWSKPNWINETKMIKSMNEMVENEVMYGNSLSYRNMCRFNSGWFFREEIMMKYDYYFRVEPSVEFYCDFQYDPFTYLRETNKIYGFVITLYEDEKTIPSLWNDSINFFNLNPNYKVSDNSFEFLIDKKILDKNIIPISSNSYNLCHFWSNFEIANLNFFRSEGYIKYFEYLESKGGFYYERWGDAPVHTIALSLMLPKSKIHHFNDIGYYHHPFQRCPTDVEEYVNKRCVCPKRQNFDTFRDSCLPRWWRMGNKRFLE